MRVEKVQHLDQVEQVRGIRNSCREWMTRDTRHIGSAQQWSWWNAAPRELYLCDDVAYALITERDGRKWISLGVLPDERGRGIGTAIYQLFRDVFAEIRSDNHASRRAAEKAGYTLVSDDGEVVVMQR